MTDASHHPSRRVLLTGATGFVGRHVYPALAAAGYEVRSASRRPDRGRRELGDWNWVTLDVERPETLAEALEGCQAAIYLVHQMHAGRDYPERERAAASTFRGAADAAGVERVVYLGGVIPAQGASRHLTSRRTTGEVLRQGTLRAIELRAAMIIGRGSESWLMVHDLAARLPAMILPKWLRNHSWPVAIDDVVMAILGALSLPGSAAGWYDVPGPERLTHRQVLDRASAVIRGRRPFSVPVPILTPRLSSYWIALVTGVGLDMARELVEGVRYDLDPSGPIIWDVIPDHRPLSLEEAMRLALADERDGALLPEATRERLAQLGARLGDTVAPVAP